MSTLPMSATSNNQWVLDPQARRQAIRGGLTLLAPVLGMIATLLWLV